MSSLACPPPEGGRAGSRVVLYCETSNHAEVSLSRLLRRGDIEIVSRVFGLILTNIAVTNVIVAIKLSFNLT